MEGARTNRGRPSGVGVILEMSWSRLEMTRLTCLPTMPNTAWETLCTARCMENPMHEDPPLPSTARNRSQSWMRTWRGGDRVLGAGGRGEDAARPRRRPKGGSGQPRPHGTPSTQSLAHCSPLQRLSGVGSSDSTTGAASLRGCGEEDEKDQGGPLPSFISLIFSLAMDVTLPPTMCISRTRSFTHLAPDSPKWWT